MTRRRILLTGAGVLISAGLLWMLAANRAEPGAHPGLGVSLVVNLERQLAISPGTPLQLEVSLSGSGIAGPFQIGGWWRGWPDYIRLEPVDQGPGLPWSVQRAAATSSTLHTDADTSTAVSTTGGVAHFEEGRQVHTVTYFVSPEATAGAPGATYRLRAVVESPWWQRWGWRGRVASAPVTISIKAPDETLERRRRHLAARFYLFTGRIDEAKRLAEELRVERPDDPAALILVGDVFDAAHEPDRALAAYQRALSRLPPSYEEPTLLLDRIRRVSGPATKSEAR